MAVTDFRVGDRRGDDNVITVTLVSQLGRVSRLP